MTRIILLVWCEEIGRRQLKQKPLPLPESRRRCCVNTYPAYVVVVIAAYKVSSARRQGQGQGEGEGVSGFNGQFQGFFFFSFS
ncbi:hypothetical protein I7I53_11799 [Histoplasma capsulatum var. duboisii H88]|uniref:Uncharacterized protein n=1 Tax=Ajellomyces capsulatus (strain H88) TaxID=544711 RepID=A0A8A1LYF0_AJEC8|nr:hypothetical protein I7I53_11799 [Histoplasma capsulatum var. duboisii H88]